MNKAFMSVGPTSGGHFRFNGNEPQRREPITCEYKECKEIVWQCCSVFCHNHQVLRLKEYQRNYKGGRHNQYLARVKRLKSKRLLKRFRLAALVNRHLLKVICPCCKLNKIEKTSLCCSSCANKQHLMGSYYKQEF